MTAPTRSTIARSLLVLAALAVAVPAAARDDQRVAVGAIDGVRDERQTIVGLQRELRRLPRVDIQTTSGFRKEAARQGAADRLPDDPRALSAVAHALQVDAVIYGRVEKPRRRRRDRVLILTVYNGGDGTILGEHSIRVRRGRFTRGVWRRAARALEDDIRRGDHTLYAVRPPPPPSPPPPAAATTFEPVPVAVDMAPVADEAPDDGPPAGARADLVRLRAGIAVLSRTFEYAADAASPQFGDGGIQYESSLSPGVAIEAELYPLAALTAGPGGNVGIGVRFEKVFLGTRQTVTLDDGTTEERDLETDHHHLVFDLRYRHRFGTGDAAPELGGRLGMGLLDFALEDNPEYRGTSYTYFLVGAGARVPLGTPLLAADVQLAWIPTADLGDSVEELGEEASASGFAVFAGLSSRVGDDFTLQGGFDLTSFSADVSGTGRGGRIGKTADDRYLGFRVMAGYRF